MSLKFALLGQLSKRAMTGYELKQFIDMAIGHFWAADHPQIYRTLSSLEEEGLISASLEIQADRPNRKRYTVTSAGRAALLEWLLTPQPAPLFRDPFLVQLFFARQLSNAQILDLLRQQLQSHQEKLQGYLATRELIAQTAADAREVLFESLTLELGMAVETAYITWLEQSITRF